MGNKPVKKIKIQIIRSTPLPQHPLPIEQKTWPTVQQSVEEFDALIESYDPQKWVLTVRRLDNREIMKIKQVQIAPSSNEILKVTKLQTGEYERY